MKISFIIAALIAAIGVGALPNPGSPDVCHTAVCREVKPNVLQAKHLPAPKVVGAVASPSQRRTHARLSAAPRNQSVPTVKHRLAVRDAGDVVNPSKPRMPKPLPPSLVRAAHAFVLLFACQRSRSVLSERHQLEVKAAGDVASPLQDV